MDSVFIGFSEVAGRYQALQRGFEEIGVEVTFVVYRRSKYYETPKTRNALVNAYLKVVQDGFEKNQNPLYKLIRKVVTLLGFTPFLIWALRNHNLFVFASGKSFFSIFQFMERVALNFLYIDYRLLSILGKKTIAQFHGSDSRPPYLNGAIIHATKGDASTLIKLTRRKYKEICLVNKFANHIIDIPPQGYFHSRQYILRLYSGLPSGPHQQIQQQRKGPLKIVHAPSNSNAKGTKKIEEDIADLSKIYDIEYRRIENVSNSKLLQIVAESDIVVDQLYCDYGLAGLATEACWFGKPVIIGGYATDLWHRLLQEDAKPPTIYCPPAEVRSNLVRLLEDREYRITVGQRGLRFIKERHHPVQVAKNFLRIFNNDVPGHWTYDPDSTKEIYGGFFSEKEQIRQTVSYLFNSSGSKVFCLDDKPDLLDELVGSFLEKDIGATNKG